MSSARAHRTTTHPLEEPALMTFPLPMQMPV